MITLTIDNPLIESRFKSSKEIERALESLAKKKSTKKSKKSGEEMVRVFQEIASQSNNKVKVGIKDIIAIDEEMMS